MKGNHNYFRDLVQDVMLDCAAINRTTGPRRFRVLHLSVACIRPRDDGDDG